MIIFEKCEEFILFCGCGSSSGIQKILSVQNEVNYSWAI